MPALPDVPQVIKVEAEWQLADGGFSRTRLYAHYSGVGPDAPTLITFLDALQTHYHGSGGPSCLSNDKALANWYATDLTTPSSAHAAVSVGDTGTRGTPAPPVSACVVTNWIINRRYRGGKPKAFWPFGIASDVVGDNAWDSGLLSTVNTMLTALLGELGGHTWSGGGTDRQVSVGYYEGFVNFTGPTGRTRPRSTLREVSGVPTPNVDTVTGIEMDNRIGSQRRRLSL